MRTVAHLSDLHFGRHAPEVVEALIADLTALAPDLVAVSGDLTQRARRREFAAAREFLASLPAPVIAVPGNHDVPLYDIVRRTFRPLHRFARYISDARQPFFADAEIAVLGINTARSTLVSGGRISHDQMAQIRRGFAEVPQNTLRILVTHHPLLAPPHAPARRSVGRAEHALDAVAEAGVAMLLTGHHHQSFSGDLVAELALSHSLLVSEAGTATSTRLRREVNAYNLIRIAGRDVTCTQRAWSGAGFEAARALRFTHAEGRWAQSG